MAVDRVSDIGLGPCDVRFCKLNKKIAYYFRGECMIFTYYYFVFGEQIEVVHGSTEL